LSRDPSNSGISSDHRRSMTSSLNHAPLIGSAGSRNMRMCHYIAPTFPHCLIGQNQYFLNIFLDPNVRRMTPDNRNRALIRYIILRSVPGIALWRHHKRLHYQSIMLVSLSGADNSHITD
jgi:hypothetical protein